MDTTSVLVPATDRQPVAALSRSMALAVVAGAVGGAVVGVLSRLAMRLLARTSPQSAQGRLTDDLAIVGVVSVDGTLALLSTTIGAGGIAGLLYLLVRRALPREVRWRVLGSGLFGAAVGGALLVKDHGSFDYSALQPEWLSTLLFVLLPALGGALTALLVEGAERLDRRHPQVPTAALVGVAILASVPGLGLAFSLPMAVVALAVAGISPLRSAWAHPAVTIAGRVLFVILVAVGVTDLVADVVSMRTDVAR